MQPSPAHPILCLKLPPDRLAGFASLLQHGIFVPLERPVPLLAFLVSLPGFSAEYIEKNVQTIFLDGVATDSLERDLEPGITVALSAAMPGLAGAIFRRQGIHGSLRSQPASSPDKQTGPGFLTLKLFNAIATDRIGDLLRQGILVSGNALQRFAHLRDHLFQPPARLTLDGRSIDHAALLERAASLTLVRVRLASTRD